jgi:hypothetical protein
VTVGPLILGAPNAIVKPPAFRDEEVAVLDVGEHVEFRIGNSTLTFHYEDALKISQMIRVHAKHAKNRAGDQSRHWSALAMLEDLKG